MGRGREIGCNGVVFIHTTMKLNLVHLVARGSYGSYNRWSDGDLNNSRGKTVADSRIVS